MRRQILVLLLVTVFPAHAAFGQGALMKLEGDVIRENGSPVAGVKVVAVQRAWSLVGPIADRELARVISDHRGYFTIEVPHGTNIRRLILVAGGEWNRMESNDRRDIALMGTSVPLRKVTKNGRNRIIVPNSFRPAK
jgi:hypothetical protein